MSGINNAPSFTKGADVTVLEDAGVQSLANWAADILAGPPNESGQTLSFTVTNNTNPALFSAGPALAADGALSFTPAADAEGSATVSIVLHDNGGTAGGGQDTSPEQSFTITVTPVNDAPSFDKGADVSAAQNAGAQSLANWAANISPGPANESGQALSFVLTANSNPALFSAGPAVAADGTLSFTPAPSAAPGSATISLALHDDGGTANGGQDASPEQTFTITVTPQATFDLSLAFSGAGSGSVTLNSPGATCSSSAGPCVQTYAAEMLVTLTAAPDSGSTFAGWGGACAGTSGDTCQVTLNEALNVTAAFELQGSGESLVYLPLIQR